MQLLTASGGIGRRAGATEAVVARRLATAALLSALAAVVAPATAQAQLSPTPFLGAPAAIPGTVEAENFDDGGEGVAYHDTTAGNGIGAYRATDVDVGVTPDASGGYHVGWTDPGEWTGYTVTIATAASYAVAFRAATTELGKTLHLEVDGVDVTGPVTIRTTGSWSVYDTTVMLGVRLPAGTHFLKVVWDAGWVDLNFVRFTAPTPFGGSPAQIPGTLEAENFDDGGEGVAYHDTTAGNGMGAYRNTDVDVGVTPDSTGGYHVGWTDPGEWTGYTVSVASAGAYTASFRAATTEVGKTLHLEVDGVDVTGPVPIPPTGSWSVYATTVKEGIALPAGTHFLQIVWDAGWIDLNSVAFAASASPPPGASFYVATTGSDAAPGTEAQPWRSIQKAMSSATPGSTVHIRGGTYAENLVVNVSGSAAAGYVTFQNYGYVETPGGVKGGAIPGEQVVVSLSGFPTDTTRTPFLEIGGRSYVRIRGITWTGHRTLAAPGKGLWIEGGSDHIEIRDCKFHDNKSTGPHDGLTSYAHIRVFGAASDVLLYGNEIWDVVTTVSETLTADGAGVARVTIENNYVHDTDKVGIDVLNGAHDFTVRGNVLEYVSTKRDGTQYWPGDAGVSIAIYVDGGNTGVIEGNLIRNTAWGIEVLSEDATPAAHDVTVRNNVIHDAGKNSAAGILIGTWYPGKGDHDVFFYNNTVYGCSLGASKGSAAVANEVFRNNLFRNNAGGNVNDPFGFAAWSYNGFSGTGGTLTADANRLDADPLFVNPASEDFSLPAGSPALDRGDPTTTTASAGTTDFAGAPRIVNGRIDLGAREHP
jgi:hypothetical protein